MKSRLHHIAMLLVSWFFDDMHPTPAELEAEGVDFGSWA